MNRGIGGGLAIAACVLAACAGCGGSSSTAPASTATEPGSRPVRVDAPQASGSDGPRPVRVAPTTPGEAAESDDLAAPPPVEAPTP